MYLLKASSSIWSSSPYIDTNKFLSWFTPHTKVVFFALGKSFHAVKLAVSIANSFNLRWYVVDAGSALHGDAGIVGPRDTLVFVSKSGKTREVLEVAKHFRDYSKYAITSSKNSPLQTLCSDHLYLPILDEYSPFGHAPMTSSIFQAMILMQAVSDLVYHYDIPIEQYANYHPAGTIGQTLNRSDCDLADLCPDGQCETGVCVAQHLKEQK